jgi:hypothetical protein
MNWGGGPKQSVFWEKDKMYYYDEYHTGNHISFPPTWWDWFRANIL